MKSSGMPMGLATSKQAPVSDKLRTTQSTVDATPSQKLAGGSLFTPAWAASVGLIYFSDSFASSDDSVKLPGFFRVDAGVFTKINETWRAQLNIENVFNKGYWASADGNNNITPGQPRTVRLTAFAKF